MLGIFKKEEKNVDADLPFNAKLGSLITIQASPLLEAELAGSLVPLINPKLTNPSQPVVAISRLRSDFMSNLKIFRFYLDKGDNNEQSETYIQVTTDLKMEPQEIILFTKFARIVPTSRDEQEAYLGTNDVGLGEINYDLWSGLLPYAKSSDKVKKLFGESELIAYNRDFGEGEDYIRPLKAEEERVDSKDGSSGLTQKVYFMPYARSLTETGSSDLFEQLLISTEIVTSVDGDPNNKSLHVDFMVGIPLHKSRITIL